MRKFNVNVNGKTYSVEVDEVGGAPAIQTVVSEQPVPIQSTASMPIKPVAGGMPVNSPMPGTVLEVSVTSGQTVKANDKLLILEAMKMENPITSPRDGVVTVHVSKGAKVETGELLVTIA